MGLRPVAKALGEVGRNDEDLGHGQAGLGAEALHDLVDAGEFLARYRLRAAGHDGQLVAEEVGEEIHRPGKAEGHHRAVPASDGLPDEHQKDGHRRQQECGLEVVCHSVYVDAIAGWKDAPIRNTLKILDKRQLPQAARRRIRLCPAVPG